MRTAETFKKHRYLEIVELIEDQIQKSILKAGDKLPSIRSICDEYQVSMSTAQLAYSTLVGRSFIESRPKSGYYVSNLSHLNVQLPKTSTPQMDYTGESAGQLVSSVFNANRDQSIIGLSSGVPSNEYLPIPQLNRAIKQAMQELKGSGTESEKIEGNSDLRREIAKWSYHTGAHFSEDDIITTNGCINGVAYSLMTLTQPGDTVAIESPVFFGLLQLLESMKLNVIELPTNPEYGIEIDALKKVIKLRRPKVVILISNFNNPLGSCMPDSHKEEVVKLLLHHNIPLIEDDIYGDLYFGKTRPRSCKSFDEAGMVMWCCSVSKTMAPGYRVGWVVPGKFAEGFKRTKMVNSLYSITLTQQAIAIFLKTGKYENYLRNLRRLMYENSLKYTCLINKFFPEGTKISRPKGSLYLWVELDKSKDTVKLFNESMKQNIGIAPGRIFTLQDQYNNCFRLSYGLNLTPKVENSIKTLGEIIRKI